MIHYDILKNNKIKITFARKVILNILSNSEVALSAEYIYDKCKDMNQGINLSTVYRTLEIYEEKDIVEKFDLGDRRYSYSLKKKDHKHVIECSLCHKEVELDCPVKMLEEIIKSKTGFTMMEHDLHIKGVCQKCRKDKEDII